MVHCINTHTFNDLIVIDHVEDTKYSCVVYYTQICQIMFGI